MSPLSDLIVGSLFSASIPQALQTSSSAPAATTAMRVTRHVTSPSTLISAIEPSEAVAIENDPPLSDTFSSVGPDYSSTILVPSTCIISAMTRTDASSSPSIVIGSNSGLIGWSTIRLWYHDSPSDAFSLL